MSEEKTIEIGNKTLMGFFIAIIVIVVAFFLFNGNFSTSGNVIAVGGPGEVVEIKTIIKSFQYLPDVITVSEGSLVKLTIENKDSVTHGLHLPQFGLIDSIPPGTKTFQFTATETPTNGVAVPTCSQEHGETLTINVV